VYRDPRGDSRPRLSGRAELDKFLLLLEVAELCSAGQPGAAVRT